MEKDHEKAGYEYEKGRQKFQDERNAELEAERQIRAGENYRQGRRTCCKGFKRVILAGLLFLLVGFPAAIYADLNPNTQDDWTDPWYLLSVAGMLFAVLMCFVVAPVLAFIGAMNMLCGCLLGISDD